MKQKVCSLCGNKSFFLYFGTTRYIVCSKCGNHEISYIEKIERDVTEDEIINALN